MPAFVVAKVTEALNRDRKAVNGSRVLILGVSYKRDIDDLRETPAFEVMRLLQEHGAIITYHDPHCPAILDDGHTPLQQLPMFSIPLTDEALAEADCVLIITDHTCTDYPQVARSARLVVDTRGVMRGIESPARVVGLSSLDLHRAAHV
jgi:UDP-N-acetyl-D-glucosamine dehydrogenase